MSRPLTYPDRRVYAYPVAPHWASGICNPSLSAQALFRSAFRLSPSSMAGCREALRGTVPQTGIANSLHPATHFRFARQVADLKPSLRPPAMSTSLSILSTNIRQVDGLYSLNDLHQASGGEPKNKPALFLGLDKTQDLINEIAKGRDSYLSETAEEGAVTTPVVVIDPAIVRTVRGVKGGTFACKQVVVAYGAWINPRVHLAVIDAFLDQQAINQQVPALPALITPAQAGELSTLIAERFPEGKQRPYAWSRFKNHFRVASYRELPASRFAEACAYIPTMPGATEQAALPAPVIDPALTPISDRLAHGRFLATFENNRLHLREIERDAYVMADHAWPNVIRHEPVTSEVLLDLLDAVAAKLNRRPS